MGIIFCLHFVTYSVTNCNVDKQICLQTNLFAKKLNGIVTPFNFLKITVTYPPVSFVIAGGGPRQHLGNSGQGSPQNCIKHNIFGSLFLCTD